MVEREVGGDPEEPGTGPLVAGDFREMLPRTQKCLLAEVGCRLLISGHAPKIAEEIWLVLRKERLEGFVHDVRPVGIGSSFNIGRLPGDLATCRQPPVIPETQNAAPVCASRIPWIDAAVSSGNGPTGP